MTVLSRRRVLTAAAAATLAPALAPLAPSRPRAAAPPAGKQAPGWYRYKVGSIEVTVVTDGANTFKFADNHVTNKSRDEVNAALAAAYYEKDMMTTPYNPVVVNTGSQARRHRHRHRRGELRAQQGRDRAVPDQPQGRRHRPQRGRRRDHLAFPRRPHQRPAHARQQAGLPECRDHGAGAGVEVLHGRRRDEPRDRRTA